LISWEEGVFTLENGLFLKNRDVVKELSTGTTYLCIKTFGDEALIVPTQPNGEGEWSFRIKDQIVVSNKSENYNPERFEFIERRK
jgi:hypothetical protein